jgi:hypothetical protein
MDLKPPVGTTAVRIKMKGSYVFQNGIDEGYDGYQPTNVEVDPPKVRSLPILFLVPMMDRHFTQPLSYLTFLRLHLRMILIGMMGDGSAARISFVSRNARLSSADRAEAAPIPNEFGSMDQPTVAGRCGRNVIVSESEASRRFNQDNRGKEKREKGEKEKDCYCRLNKLGSRLVS